VHTRNPPSPKRNVGENQQGSEKFMSEVQLVKPRKKHAKGKTPQNWDEIPSNGTLCHEIRD